MEYREIPISFDCEGNSLLGILSLPQVPTNVGVVIVVGGPQYRVGSHRQFVHLARALAAGGFACLRFDYRGMGDSEGNCMDFEKAGPDISSAVAALIARVGVRSVVLWGLCDGATACALKGADPLVSGMVLFNPWIRTDAGALEVAIRHYYAKRWLDRRFWRKLRSGNVDIGAGLIGFLRNLQRFAVSRMCARRAVGRSLPDRVARGIDDHRGPVLVVLSGNDQTAAEYELVSARPGLLSDAMRRPGVTVTRIPKADHTLSTARWRDDAAAITLGWLNRHFAGGTRYASAGNPGKERHT